MSGDPFLGDLPEDRLYHPEHDMWVRWLDPWVEIGASSHGLLLAGEIIGFTAKPVGARVDRGRGLATVELHKTVLAVRAPLSLIVLAGNGAAEADAGILNTDPYGAGWMVRGHPLAWELESAALIDARSYRARLGGSGTGGPTP